MKIFAQMDIVRKYFWAGIIVILILSLSTVGSTRANSLKDTKLTSVQKSWSWMIAQSALNLLSPSVQNSLETKDNYIIHPPTGLAADSGNEALSNSGVSSRRSNENVPVRYIGEFSIGKWDMRKPSEVPFLEDRDISPVVNAYDVLWKCCYRTNNYKSSKTTEARRINDYCEHNYHDCCIWNTSEYIATSIANLDDYVYCRDQIPTCASKQQDPQ